MTQEALKLALEALEVDAYVYNGEKSWKAITAIKQALAQTQEPVAEIVSDTFGCLSTKWRDEWTPNEGDKLYTTPPKRTWVGLTDEEYKELHLQMGPVYYYQEYGQAIEAKLKEKNT